MSTGGGKKHLSEVLAAINVPSMTKKSFIHLPSFSSSSTYISLMDDGTWISWCSTEYGSTNFSYENS